MDGTRTNNDDELGCIAFGDDVFDGGTGCGNELFDIVGDGIFVDKVFGR